MSNDQFWAADDLKRYPGSDLSVRLERPVIRKSTLGLVIFAVAGVVVTAILAGESAPRPGMAAFFINGQMVSVGRHSLDLSKPIFMRGATPVCGSEDALQSFSPANPGDCTLVTSSAPAALVAIQTDGMREPSLQMLMQTTSGPVRGWVRYNNLQN